MMQLVTRRRFAFGGLLGGMSAVGGTAAVGYNASTRAPYEPVLERISLTVPDAHTDLAGLRIGFVTDTHVGPFVTPGDVARALALVAAEGPDLILLGGDYISASPRYATPAAEVLATVTQRAPLGGIAVLGNHDCGEHGRAEQVTAALTAVGIRVLRNESVAIETGRGQLWIAGVDEAIMARADPVTTFRAIPAGAAVIALWHEPDYANATAAQGAFAQLSGHSHGGQVRLPLIGPLFLPRGGKRYVMGTHHAQGMPVYTSRGVGIFFPPLRLGCSPEVTLVTLMSP
jgi:predicted MPP superfamily phosphohydrolase